MISQSPSSSSASRPGDWEALRGRRRCRRRRAWLGEWVGGLWVVLWVVAVHCTCNKCAMCASVYIMIELLWWLAVYTESTHIYLCTVIGCDIRSNHQASLMSNVYIIFRTVQHMCIAWSRRSRETSRFETFGTIYTQNNHFILKRLLMCNVWYRWGITDTSTLPDGNRFLVIFRDLSIQSSK